MATKRPPKKILHLHAGFDLGGKEARTARLMNVFGDAAHHVVLTTEPDSLGAAVAVDPAISVDYPGLSAPSLNGLPSPGRYREIARYFRGFDLLLSYNWGAMDAVMAHRMFSPFMKLPPLIHHEDGFNEDEHDKRMMKRDLFRRLGLTSAYSLVVPSRLLEAVARDAWKVPERKLERIPNGIALAAFDGIVTRAEHSVDDKFAGKIVVGTLAGLRPIKDLGVLVRAVAKAGEDIALLIAGEGSERASILAEAERCGISDRLLMPGIMKPAEAVARFDIFALSSQSEQYPISLVEAMAARKPAACYAVGDIAAMVSSENAPFIVDWGEEDALAAAIRTLADDPELRTKIGEANRARVERENDEAVMIERYRTLYGTAMGDADFAGHLR